MTAAHTRLRASLQGVFALALALSLNPATYGQGAEKPQNLGLTRLDSSSDALPKGAIARLGNIRFRHPGSVSSVFFSKDGKRLISSGELDLNGRTGDRDGIRIWDVRTGKLLRTVGGFPYGPDRIAMSSDEKLVAGPSGGSSVGVLDFDTGRFRYKFTWPYQGINGCAFSPDGKTLALSGGDSKVQLWSTETGEILHTFGPEDSCVLVYSPDGKTLASCGKTAIHLWDAATRKEMWRTETDGFGMGTFSPDGKLIAVGGDPGGAVWLLETSSGRKVRKWLAHKSRVHTLSFSPNGAILATGADTGEIRLWSVTTGEEIHRLHGHGRGTYSVAFSPDGKMLASGGQDNRIRLWEVDSGKEVLADEYQDDVTSLDYAPDGRVLASGDRNGIVRIWDLNSYKEIKRFREGREPITSVVYSPDGKMLATSCGAQTVRLHDLLTDQKHLLVGDGQYLTFHPDGNMLVAIDSSNAIRLWDVQTHKNVRAAKPLPGARWWPRSLSLSADGKNIALGRDEGAIYICDVSSGRLLKELPSRPDTTVVYRPGAKEVGTLDEEGLCQLVDVNHGRKLVRYRGEQSRYGVIAFSMDGWFLAYGDATWDGRLIVWEVFSGIEVLRLQSPEPGIRAITFAPDGRSIATATGESSVLVWDAVPPGVREKASSQRLSEKDLEAAWEGMLSENGPETYKAIWRLRGSPREAVSFLGKRLAPVPPIPMEPIARCLAQLDDPSSAIREKATRELERMGPLALPALEKAHEKSSSPEVRARCEVLLEKIKEPPLSMEQLREFRALAVIEYAGTPESQALLERLANGAAGAGLTREAFACLNRLSKRRIFAK